MLYTSKFLLATLTLKGLALLATRKSLEHQKKSGQNQHV